MSQTTTTTTESGESSKRCGQESDTLNLPCLSRQIALNVAIQDPGTETSSIRRLLKEFAGLYEQRLRCLELDTTLTQEQRLQKKVTVLLSYVNDLADQNQVLVQTIEDLQKEADTKISNEAWKPHMSDHTLEVPEVDLKTLSLDELLGTAADIPHSKSGALVQTASELEALKSQLQTKNMAISDLERELRETFQQKQKTAIQVLESNERLVHLQRELSCLQQIQKDSMKEIAEKDICITKLQANIKLLQHKGIDTHAQDKMVSLRAHLSPTFDRRMEEKEMRINQLTVELNRLRQKMKEREDCVKHLEQDVSALRATQDSLERTLATKETHTQHLVQDNTRLKESLASLQRKLQMNKGMFSDISESLDQTKTVLNTERQQRQQIQDQLHHANKEMERLRQELTHVRRTTEKKIQKREIKMCALLTELTESNKQHSECQNELLQRDASLEKLCKEMDELRAKMEDRGRECVHLNHTKERLEADLALCHDKLHTSHLEVRSRDQLILQLRAEMKTAEQKYPRTQKQVAALEGEVRDLKQEVRGRQKEACQLSNKVTDAEYLKDQKEKEQQHQVKTFVAKLKKQEAEMELLHQQLMDAKKELKDASLQAREHKETVVIFKQKYTAAIDKVHRVQGQVEHLQEELQFSQQQLRDSQLATQSVKKELAEMMQRYQDKVGQWENSQEALDQLTDELQANQNLLRQSQQKEDHLKGQIGSLQEQADTFEQQKLMLECDFQLYQQSYSHSDEEYLSLLRHRLQLQKRCTEQVERLAECEKAILQMKSELERQAQEKADLKQSLVASHCTQMNNCSQLNQEVLRLKKEVACLKLMLADARKVHTALLRQTEEKLMEARQEAARRTGEVGVQKGEVLRLQEELQKQEEEMKSAIRQKLSLSSQVSQLSQELKELNIKHKVTVEDLAARAEEARQMEGCLNEGKLAEGKIRSVAVRLETEMTELRRNLQQAVDHKLIAEWEKQDAQDKVDTLQAKLEGMQSDNAKLRHESQMVMKNINHWIAEQKFSNESLSAQMKAQNKLLLIINEEKEHLQEANDTLKAEVKRLKEVADEKERDMEFFKAQIRDQGSRQDKRNMEKQGCAALNLSKIMDMQTRLQHNLEAIGMLNQQLNTLSRENKHLRRQLEEERSMRLLPPPPASQQRSSVRLPFSHSGRPSPPSSFIPSSLCLSQPLSLDAVTGNRILTHSKLSGAGKPGESQALGAASRIRSTAAVCLERCSVWEDERGSDQMKPLEDLDLS